MFSVLASGAGHVYSGAVRRGVAWTLIVAVVLPLSVAVLVATHGRPVATVLLAAGVLALLVGCAVDAVRIARRHPGRTAPAGRAVLLAVTYSIAVMILYQTEAGCLRTVWVQAFRVPSGGMSPETITRRGRMSGHRSPGRCPLPTASFFSATISRIPWTAGISEPSVGMP